MEQLTSYLLTLDVELMLRVALALNIVISVVVLAVFAARLTESALRLVLHLLGMPVGFARYTIREQHSFARGARSGTTMSG